MGEDFLGGRSLCWIEREQGGKERGSGGGEEREFGADNSTGGLGCAREAERACIRETFEAGPGCFSGDATELEDLLCDLARKAKDCLSVRKQAHF